MAWANDEPASLVSYCLTHLLRGWGIDDGRRTQTADRVARCKTRLVVNTWLCYSYHKRPRLSGGCFALFRCFRLPAIPSDSYSHSVYI